VRAGDTMKKLTAVTADLIAHAVGYDRATPTPATLAECFRNNFAAGTEHLADWQELTRLGYAELVREAGPPFPEPLYRVTSEGFAALVDYLNGRAMAVVKIEAQNARQRDLVGVLLRSAAFLEMFLEQEAASVGSCRSCGSRAYAVTVILPDWSRAPTADERARFVSVCYACDAIHVIGKTRMVLVHDVASLSTAQAKDLAVIRRVVPDRRVPCPFCSTRIRCEDLKKESHCVHCGEKLEIADGQVRPATSLSDDDREHTDVLRAASIARQVLEERFP
jgi:hypothetical protein